MFARWQVPAPPRPHAVRPPGPGRPRGPAQRPSPLRPQRHQPEAALGRAHRLREDQTAGAGGGQTCKQCLKILCNTWEVCSIMLFPNEIGTLFHKRFNHWLSAKSLKFPSKSQFYGHNHPKLHLFVCCIANSVHFIYSEYFQTLLTCLKQANMTAVVPTSKDVTRKTTKGVLFTIKFSTVQ